jgi:translation initiation factor 2 subunit 1
MVYLKKSLPSKDDLLVCTIERLAPHECFVKLDEYKNIDGMLHTSEMDRRTVRNMRVLLKPGRQLVCKVMDVNPSQINLSLRRVGEGQRRSKLQEWKNEKRADDLLQFFAKKGDLNIEDLYNKFDKVVEEYGGVYPFMLEVARLGENALDELDIKNKVAHELFELIQQRIKLPKATIQGELRMHSNKGDGLFAIKKVETEIQKIAKKNDLEIKLSYSGAPKYNILISAENKKDIEQTIEEIIARVQSLLGGKSNAEFIKSKK